MSNKRKQKQPVNSVAAKSGARSWKQSIDEMEPMPQWAKIVTLLLLAGLIYKWC